MYERFKKILNIYMENSNIVEPTRFYQLFLKGKNYIAYNVRDRLLDFLGKEIHKALEEAMSVFAEPKKE